MTGYKQFYDQYWKNFNQSLNFRHLAALELIEKSPVLDLGCGDGLFMEMLKRKGITSKGLDISNAAIAKAKLRGLDVEVFDFAKNKLPYPDNTFYCVTLLDVLEHFYHPKNLLAEIHRVSKYAVIVVPNFAFFTFRLQALLGKTPLILSERKGHVYYVTYNKLLKLLSDSKFEIEAEKYYIALMNKPYIGKFCYMVGSLRPSIFATAFAIKAKAIDK